MEQRPIQPPQPPRTTNVSSPIASAFQPYTGTSPQPTNTAGAGGGGTGTAATLPRPRSTGGGSAAAAVNAVRQSPWRPFHHVIRISLDNHTGGGGSGGPSTHSSTASAPANLPPSSAPHDMYWQDEQQRLHNLQDAVWVHSSEAQGIVGGAMSVASYDNADPELPDPALAACRRRVGARPTGFDERAAGRDELDEVRTDAEATAAAAAAETLHSDSTVVCSSPNRPEPPTATRAPSADHTGLFQRLIRATSGGLNSAATGAAPSASLGGPMVQSSAYADLLAPLTPSQQVVLRFNGICSFVPAQLQPPSLFQRVRRGVRWVVRREWRRPGQKPQQEGKKGNGTQGPVTTRAAGEGGGKADGGGGAGGRRRGPPRRRQILFDVSGQVIPGQVLALMGPSGSGKTSLLSVLGGRTPPRVTVRGVVSVNGLPLNKAMRRRIGFVLQDDVLYETLTVHETLLYAALLRLPASMSGVEKRRRVEGVMAGLGLSRSRDTIIGGFFRRGISGGERKRVSVGHELLIDPAVLMFDEPTSGLDSTTALHLVQLLRQLATGGRALVTTIHQPSSRLYRQLDRVMLLSEGHVMYCGDANMAADWFGHFGFGLPYGISLADFILDCAMGEVVASQEAADAAAAGMPRHSSLQSGPSTGDAYALDHLTAPTSTHRLAPGGMRVIPPAPSPRSGLPFLAILPRQPPWPHAAHRVVVGLTGRPAAVALYTTFERWYASHPDGFHSPSQLEGVELHVMGAGAAGGGGGGGGAVVLGNGRAGKEHGAVKDEGTATTRAAAPAAPHEATGPLPQQTPTATTTTTTTTPLSMYDKGIANGGANGAGGGGAVQSPFQEARVQQPPSQGPDSMAVEGGSTMYGVGDGGGDEDSSSGSSGCAGGGGRRDAAPYIEQLRVLWTRAVKVRRFESLSAQNLAQLLAVALITGLLWFQRGTGHQVAAGGDVMGLLFFELLFPSFKSMFSALFTFPNEYRMLKKERPAGMYKLSAYYLARTASDLPMELLYPTLFVTVVYWLGGLRATAGAFFCNLLSMLLIVLLAQSWGLLFGGSFMDPKIAQTISTVIMLTFLLVGGFYVKQVPVWISWVKYLSFVYWGYNLLLKIQFGHNPYYQGEMPVDVQTALGLPISPNANPGLEVGVLIAMLLLLRAASYIVLRRKTEVRQPKQETSLNVS